MLTLDRHGSCITVETLGGRLTFDAACGGQIVEFVVKNELASHLLLKKGGVLPDMRLTMDGKQVRLLDAHAEMAVTLEEPDVARITARNVLHDGALTLTLEYEVHEEGVLFCSLFSEIAAGDGFDLGACSFRMSLDTDEADKARWATFMRAYEFKRDFTSVHALAKFRAYQELGQSSDAKELSPLVSLDLGWKETRFFSNHVEFFLEDWTAFHDLPQECTRTRVGMENGAWQVQWDFYDGATVKLRKGAPYRNRWGMTFGRARSRSGPGTDAAVRNNLLGCTICHCKYPYARSSNRWPWVSMPIKQVAEQTPQLYRGNPEIARADEAADLGASLMILHQFWMKNPGSNCEPVADYRAEDPEWLRSFTERCHERGMRVAYYVRGTEMWFLYSTFFEEFLKKDWDGYYADWNLPFSMGFVKCSPLHVSLYNYFHFTKAMRRRVGPEGIMIGHSGNATHVALGCFDALLGGETSVRHDELLTDPESSAYYAFLDCAGAHFIGGNLGDRRAFASPKAAAMCAALGMTSQVNMEPDMPFCEPAAFIKPLWDSMNSLPGNIVRLHNPAYTPTLAVSTESPALYPSLWQSDAHQALLLVTNMGGEAATGAVELNLSELDLARGAAIKPLDIEGSFSEARIDGSTVRLEGIPPYAISACAIG